MGQVEGFFQLNSLWLVKKIPHIQRNPHWSGWTHGFDKICFNYYY